MKKQVRRLWLIAVVGVGAGLLWGDVMLLAGGLMATGLAISEAE